MCREEINNKGEFWNQLGFEIKNQHSSVISSIARNQLLIERSSYQQDGKQINSTIFRLVNELGLDEVLTQYVSINDGKPVDYLLSKLKMCRQKINNKDEFWNQLGFEIKNEHKEIILVIAKHSSLLHNCT
eukprot:538797_1